MCGERESGVERVGFEVGKAARQVVWRTRRSVLLAWYGILPPLPPTLGAYRIHEMYHIVEGGAEVAKMYRRRDRREAWQNLWRRLLRRGTLTRQRPTKR